MNELNYASELCNVSLTLYDVEWKKEKVLLFNDVLNTFYLRLYGVGHMVKDRSDSERGNLQAAITQATLFDWQQGIFYINHPTDRISHTTTCVTPVEEYWLEQ